MDNPKNRTILSLCTGYGGLERGIESVIGKCFGLAYVEIEAFAVANLVNKMETGKLDPVPIWTDLKTFNASPFRDCVGILTAGFPCQPFSNAGAKNGTEDPRHLWPYIETAIILCKPSTVFLENVDGIISTKTIHHRPELCEYCEWAERRLGKTWGSFIRKSFTKYFGISVLKYVKWRLERLGYRCESEIFSAEEICTNARDSNPTAPHQRKRVFILAESADNRFRITQGAKKERSTNLREAGAQRRIENRKPPLRLERYCDVADDTSIRSETRISGQKQREEGNPEILNNDCFRELADAGSKGRKECWHPGEVRRKENETCAAITGSGYQWPSRPGEPQHEWEQPRIVADSQDSDGGPGKERIKKDQKQRKVDNRQPGQEKQKTDYVAPQGERKIKPELGRTINGTRNRVDRLRLLGNGVVWQTAAKAYFTLLQKLNV